MPKAKPTSPRTLAQLAAEATPPVAGKYCVKRFAETGDVNDIHSYLSGVSVVNKVDTRVNTKGRVPPINATYYKDNTGDWISSLDGDKEIFGARGCMERASGKVRAETVLSHVGEEGVVFRTDCFSIPEMWIEATISWKVMEEAMAQRPEKRSE